MLGCCFGEEGGGEFCLNLSFLPLTNDCVVFYVSIKCM